MNLNALALVVCMCWLWVISGLSVFNQIVYANGQEKTIILQIGNPYATVDGQQVLIDEDNVKVVPILQNSRTMLPLRLIAEHFDMDVSWFAERQTVQIVGRQTIEITIGATSAQIVFPPAPPGLDGSDVYSKGVQLDSPAVIIEERTFLPVRFIAEEMGLNVEWNDMTSEVTISSMATSQTVPNEANLPQIVQDFSRITRNMTAGDISSAIGNVGVTQEIENPIRMGEGVSMAAGEDWITSSDVGIFSVWEYPEGKIEVSWIKGIMLRKTISPHFDFTDFRNTMLRDDSLYISQSIVDELSSRFENTGLTHTDFAMTLGTPGIITQMVFSDPEYISYTWASNGFDIIASFIDEQCYYMAAVSRGSFRGIGSGAGGGWMNMVAETIKYHARED